MSQSKSSYRAKTRKDSARSCRERHKKKEETSTDEPIEPACRSRSIGRGVENRKWRETTYDTCIRDFYDPCQWDECFDGEHPDEEDVETVVRSCHSPTVYHRCRHEHEIDTPQTKASAGTHSQTPIETIADLEVGEKVVWGNQPPRRVVEAPSDADEAARLVGPNDGEYTLEERSPQTYAVYPAIGIVSGIHRIEPMNASESI